MMTIKMRRTDNPSSKEHTHRRITDEDTVNHFHNRLLDIEANIDKLMASHNVMAENFNKLTEYVGRVAEVLEAWNNAKGFWVTIKFMSAIAKLFIPLAALAGAIWIAFKTGYWPKD
jgi:hypothetical protein